MKALLLAAGMGSRLRPLSEHFPKCLAPIRGVPLLAIWLHRLFSEGVDEIVVNAHHHADLVSSFLEGSPWCGRVALEHETSLLGTGGTVLRHADRFRTEPFMVAHADNLSLFGAGAFLGSHEARPPRCDMTMMTFATREPKACGIVETDSEGVVTAFHEKVPDPPGNQANAAIYVLEPAIFSHLEAIGGTFIDFSTQIIPLLVGRISTYFNDTYHRDIGTVQSLLEAQSDFPAFGCDVPYGRGWLMDTIARDAVVRRVFEGVFGRATVASWAAI